MFELIGQIHKDEISKFVNTLQKTDASEIGNSLSKIIQHIHEDIPKKKRISYGRYTIIKKLGLFMYPLFKEAKVDTFQLGLTIFKTEDNDPFVRSLGVQLASICVEDSGELTKITELFEQGAMDKDWEVRECSAGFIRKLVRTYPEAMHRWYSKMVNSENAMQRRFAVESLRPVADNNWLKKNPGFAFSILERLYTESEEYPRTSVGNSLSDWMRIDEERTLKIVKRLVASGNKNSYWIAYRACRNIVKKNPDQVMDILNVDQYKYKDRIFYREICE